MEFILHQLPRFYASVGVDRVALLLGNTVVQSEIASPAQDSGYELWHCRFGHISSTRLKSLSEGVEAQTRRGGAKPIEIGGPELPIYMYTTKKGIKEDYVRVIDPSHRA